ncbi:Magnesium protoporphyrin IX methyltransferase [Zostera marina]|uniref:Magnesium protoporphyrin IX methyltransferase n=1 Tax=Zostera marina TaxID=29655 RepID=A0A0K9PMT7_ZOSMR|nr:Magnesium protoporphyrin IX methyltransferase [Zostera marina]
MAFFSSPLSSSITTTTTPRLFKPTIIPNRSLNTRTFAFPSSFSDLSSDAGSVALVAGSLGVLAASISLADPERRRQLQAEEIGGGDTEVVKDYFNNTGFQRWKKIYGQSTEDVNKVQLDIRIGHAKTVENTILMLKDGSGSLSGITICDAGCGTGSLSIPLAKEGAIVSASDISAAMVSEAKRKAEESLVEGGTSGVTMPKFEVSDLEGLKAKNHTVVCLDVLIHYPQSKADGMIAHLASLAEERLVISFAPKTFYLSILKRIGELFPGPSKATRAYLHAEKDVEAALNKVGWKISKRGIVTTKFYFSKLIEAVPVSS